MAGLHALGGTSHLLADALLLKASGRSFAVLWPLTQYRPPTPGLYLSTDIWPSLLTGLPAGVVWMVHRRPFSGETGERVVAGGVARTYP